jgi:hypothetical protein
MGESHWLTREEIHQRWKGLHGDTKRLLSLAGIIEEIAVEVLQSWG